MSAQPKKRPAPPAVPMDPHRLERRALGRDRRDGTAMGAFYDAFGGMSLTRVRIVDASRAGVGLVSDLPAAPGSRITLYGDGLRGGVPRLTGIVARCQREGDSYRIGIRCDTSQAA